MSIQNYNIFSGVASGFKYIPYAIGAQAASAGVAVLGNWTNLKTIKNAFLRENCGIMEQMSLAEAKMGAAILGYAVSLGPVHEEFKRRNFQVYMLTFVPRIFFNLFGKGHWVDSKIAIFARTVATAVVFSEAHSVWREIVSVGEEVMNFKYAHTFGLGLVTAALQEKTGSMWPSVGLHAAMNAIALVPPMLYCATKSSDPKPTQPT
jgi:CAAX prenyl protease-like protein